jgi:hypothetical protein
MKFAETLRPIVKIAIILLIIFSVAAAIYFYDGFGLIRTRGKIFVGSPEVYTRERLVNDRYDQDFWLRNQLELLDASQKILTGELSRTDRFSFAASNAAKQEDGAGNEKPSEATVETPQPDRVKTSFSHEFQIRSGIRDNIRQMILENLLDDRHDLTGNSVYGLIFDLTVLPGINTYDRAIVKITVEPKNILVNSDSDNKSEVPEHVKEYYNSELKEIVSNPVNKLYVANILYEKWLADVAVRLNNYSEQIASSGIGDDCSCPSVCPSGEAKRNWENSVREIVETVLGIDGVTIRDAQGNATDARAVELPSPWRENLWIFAVSDEDPKGVPCATRPIFRTEQVRDAVFVYKKTLAPPIYSQIDRLDEARGIFMFMLPGQSWEEAQPRYRNIKSIVEYALSLKKKSPWVLYEFGQPPAKPGETAKPVNSPDAMIQIPSGFFNFIESVYGTDAYAYALFPKNEVLGFLAEQSSSFSAGGEVSDPAGAAGSARANFSREDSSRRSRVVPQMVGFNDSTQARSKAIDFGWEIGSGERLEATQKSGLALVSVPAWTNELKIKVTTGWLDRGSNEVLNPPYDFDIPIPPDYEAFDSFVGGNRVRRGPKIIDALMNDAAVLQPCETGSILIPGFRLWRSTAVTVGSQKADRLTVLPNMRGIIATFYDYRPEQIDQKERSEKLRVWTSEGVDTAERPVKIVPPKAGSPCDQTSGARNRPAKE